MFRVYVGPLHPGKAVLAVLGLLHRLSSVLVRHDAREPMNPGSHDKPGYVKIRVSKGQE